jgi:hypothetical protein
MPGAKDRKPAACSALTPYPGHAGKFVEVIENLSRGACPKCQP